MLAGQALHADALQTPKVAVKPASQAAALARQATIS